MAVRVAGRIISLGADRAGTAIVLDNDPSTGPLENMFKLKLDHANYNALYALALAAAANRWTLMIRIEGDGEIDPGAEAFIRNLAVSW